ncbi:hypothetical protein CF336_g9004 [Tilletia laevis]|nr:hypothetical protein CF336_g9004 [Tilletia laevis]
MAPAVLVVHPPAVEQRAGPVGRGLESVRGGQHGRLHQHSALPPAPHAHQAISISINDSRERPASPLPLPIPIFILKQDHHPQAAPQPSRHARRPHHLGIPTIEYIRAALRSIQADNPTLCSSANVLTWLRLAPSVQQLQAQAQLCAFPDLYAGIPHQHFTKLELSPRRHVQDRTRAAANIMFQNCLALFTQRGSFSRAVADLREALLLSSSSSSGEDTNNPLRSVWTDLVIASRRGAETRPSGGDQYAEGIHPELHGLLCARLRNFFNIIVRTAALRGGPLN